MKKLTIIISLLFPVYTFCQLVKVPADYHSIQEGINASNDGDTVLVDTGTYFESINFKGKAITVASHYIINRDSSFILNTIIDAGKYATPDSSYAIYFVNKEDSNSMIAGFTIKYKAWVKAQTGVREGGPFLLKKAIPQMAGNKIIGEFVSVEAINKPRVYITWVYLINPPRQMKGSLFEVQDTSLALIPREMIKQGDKSKQHTILISANQVNMVKIRRKGRIVKGAVIGAASGAALGGIIGLIAGDDPPCTNQGILLIPVPCISYTAGDKALMAGIPMAIIGAGLGALIGSIKIKIPINGNKNNFINNQQRLKGYSVKY